MPFLRIEGKHLEYEWHGPGPAEKRTLVFLHEGLGSVSMWRDFPSRLSNTTSSGALVYSRLGYGTSDALDAPRNVNFMHDEALITLPQVLDTLNIHQAILVGHSDGGSIALIHAGAMSDKRVLGLILEAPHVFVEPFGLESIRAVAEVYRTGPLRTRLQRYHEHVDSMFWGWNDIWLNPAFATWNIEEYLPRIEVPILVIQGENDQYGTWAQVEAIQNGCRGPVRTIKLEDCGHAPHVDQPERTLKEMNEFIQKVQSSRFSLHPEEHPKG